MADTMENNGSTITPIFKDLDATLSEHTVYFKLILALPSLIVAWIFSLLPIILVKRYDAVRNQDRKIMYAGALSMASMFSCGIFLGLAFLNMIPDIAHDSEQVITPTYQRFPLGHYIVAVGMLLMIILDQTLLLFREYEVDTEDPAERLNRPNENLVLIQRNFPNIPETDRPKLSMFHALVLLISLGCHSLFEGIILGAKSNFKSKVTAMFFAVMIHKVVVGLGLGLNLAQTSMKLITFIILTFLFATMTPVGIFLGFLENGLSTIEITTWLELLLQGTACGTFLYIVLFKILPQELEQGRFRLIKLCMIIFGYACICILVAVRDSIEE